MRKAFSIVLSALLLMQLCACTDTEQSSTSQKQNQQQETYGNLSDATIWGAPGTEKILQDKQGLYDDIKTEAAIDLTVAKGELEAQHIIIAAKDKKLSYTLTLNDLSASDGTVFSKENIEVFHEKYVHVKTTYDRSKLPAGWYPDALVPYENIVQAGENVVEKEQNQGLYFRFDIPTEQPAKVYAGTAKLTIGEQSQDIPITLNVADVTVSEESHAKSIFLNQWHFHKGELDTTQEMLNEYTPTPKLLAFEALLILRISDSKYIYRIEERRKQVTYRTFDESFELMFLITLQIKRYEDYRSAYELFKKLIKLQNEQTYCAFLFDEQTIMFIEIALNCGKNKDALKLVMNVLKDKLTFPYFL